MKSLKTDTKSASTFGDFEKKDEIEKLEDSLKSFNHALFDVELLFKVKAKSIEVLRERLQIISNLLQREFGLSYIESFGTYPSFMSTLPGSNPHATFRELSTGLLYYAPVFGYYSCLEQDKTPTSLLLHRRGNAKQSINLISNYHKAGNTLIIGPKGSGKSVLSGLLTQSILHDPSTKVLKMDVGSSYRRECDRFNGTRYSLTLNEPSGLNPLEVFLRTPHDFEIAHIMSDFIEVLISKNYEGKLGLTEEERADLDRLVIRYSETRPQHPSLSDFLDFSGSAIPNRVLLERWTSGMYKNIFCPSNREINNRYRYFDFESVNNASKPELVRGSIAAIMAQYNGEVAISGKTGPRIFFFCDETTEFLNHCAPFFITTVKNSRKYGHPIILINQDSESFQVFDRVGKISNALFNESDHSFLFAPPKDKADQENFKSRHELSALEFDSVSNLKSQKGMFSEVFYKSKLGGQTLKIKLSLDEYWLLTTDKKDYDKIAHLVDLGFTQEEAMQCLIQLHAKLYY